MEYCLQTHIDLWRTGSDLRTGQQMQKLVTGQLKRFTFTGAGMADCLNTGEGGAAGNLVARSSGNQEIRRSEVQVSKHYVFPGPWVDRAPCPCPLA